MSGFDEHHRHTVGPAKVQSKISSFKTVKIRESRAGGVMEGIVWGRQIRSVRGFLEALRIVSYPLSSSPGYDKGGQRSYAPLHEEAHVEDFGGSNSPEP